MKATGMAHEIVAVSQGRNVAKSKFLDIARFESSLKVRSDTYTGKRDGALPEELVSTCIAAQAELS